MASIFIQDGMAFPKVRTVAILYFILSICYSQKRSAVSKPYPGISLDKFHLLNQFRSPSKRLCFLSCLTDPFCVNFAYGSEQVCLLHEEADFQNNSKTELIWRETAEYTSFFIQLNNGLTCAENGTMIVLGNLCNLGKKVYLAYWTKWSKWKPGNASPNINL